MKKKIIYILIICVGFISITCFSWMLYDHLQLGSGNNEEVLIKKYPGNQTAFKFISSKGVKLISDPCYLNETVKADVVTEANNHIDHTETSRITGNFKLINTTGNFNIKEIHIAGYPGINSKGDNWTSNIIYVYDIDGIHIVQLSSQGEMLDEDTLKKIGKTDILIIQIIDHYTKMGLNEAYKMIKKLEAKIVIPAHGNQALNPDLAALFKEDVDYKSSGIIKVTREMLEKIKKPKILVLDNGD